MANAHCGGPNNHPNTQDVRLARLADSRTVNVPERSIDEWEAADTAQRLIELDDEARAHMTLEEYAESTARVAAVWAQHEVRALARYRASRNQIDSDVNQESPNVLNRPLDSQFGSDGNQYNPYSPHTSEEYMLQEIEAGRMDPEMMVIPQHPANRARSSLSGNGPSAPLAHVHASGHTSWMGPGHRSRFRQGLDLDLSDPPEASWFQHPSDGSTAVEELGEEEYPNVYPVMLPYLDIGRSPAGSQSPHGIAPDRVFPDQESALGIQGSLTSSLDPASLNEILALGVPRQPHPLSARRERKRLGKPSLVVKLKTDSAQNSSQAPVSLRRGRSDASSSSESSSATQITQISRPFNLRSRGSVGMSSTNVRTRAGWDPQAVRRLTRRAEAIQNSHRKRRRDAVSPQDFSTEGTITPTAGLRQG